MPTGPAIDQCSDGRTGVQRTVAVVLAAGAGRRMGGPKWRLAIGEDCLLGAHITRFKRAGLPVIVVVGPDAPTIRDRFQGVAELRENPDWRESDMAVSVEIGLRGVEFALITPVDTPPVHPDTLARLLALRGNAVPTWEGRDGHPVRVEAPHPSGRLDHRLRSAIRVPVDDPGCVEDFDTPAAWAAYLARG